MKKKVWIMNHYAINQFNNEGGRHYWFAQNLIKRNYESTIFCANTRHNSEDVIDTDESLYVTKVSKDIPFTFVKTTPYKDNGINRVKNMISFYKNLFPVTKDYSKKHGKPDVILASSVHPLTLIAGIKIAKKFNIPCICEIRDLWPETLVAYNSLKKGSLLSKLLYFGEKWIYKNADRLIFTMEGGENYLKEKGWDKANGGPIDLNKVTHINNGVDIELFEFNKKNNTINDIDLNNEKFFKVVYAGSIRKVNNVRKIIDAAQLIKERGQKNILFLIYGNGTEKEFLEKYCKDNKLENVKFKGLVDKNKIPYILSKCDLNIMHFEQNKIKEYGPSLNKMFEYFASGKPSLSDCEFGFDLINKYNSGIVKDNATAAQLSELIIHFNNMPLSEYEFYCGNAIKAANDFDLKNLSNKLEQVILELN